MKSGYRGVSWSRRHNKWRAGYELDGKQIFLGLYDDVNDAGCAAGDFRGEMGVALKLLQRRANENRSRKVKAHKENLPPEVARAIALKAHMTRQSNGPIASNKSGYEGVSWNSKRERWFVHVRVDGRRKRLGSYKDLDEAISVIEAYHATGEDPRLTSSKTSATIPT